MNWILLIISVFLIGFVVYWYFFRVPNYYGYVSKGGDHLLKYLEPKELLILIRNPQYDILILDVREEEYFLMGHIPTAVNYPYAKVEKWCVEIPQDKSLILYCDLTVKTQNVISFLEAKGRTKMLNWGKYKRWKYEETISL